MDNAIIKSRIKLGLTRIISSRVTFSFFVLTFLSAVIQIAIISSSFVNDYQVGISIHKKMAPNTTVFAMFSNTGGINNGPAVKLCTNIAVPDNPTPCDIISVGPNVPLTTSDGGSGVSPQCQQALNFPLQTLSLFKREDVTNIAINVWMLFIANYAIMVESPPHLFAFITGKISTSFWSVYTILRAQQIKPQFEAMLYSAPCSTKTIISDDYWRGRNIIQATSAIVNLVDLLILAVLCWKLTSKYNSETYSRVCASPCLITMYRFVLTLNAATQLGLFFFLASGGLWLDRLLAGGVLRWAKYPHIYVGLFGLTVALVPIWSAFGWYGVRRENNYLMSAYLFIALFFVGSWGAMFDGIIYRYYFLTWSFWSFITVLGMGILVFIVILTVFCWWNFSKGIKHWLYVRRALSSSNFAPETFDPDPYQLSSKDPMDPEFQFVLEGPTKHMTASNSRNEDEMSEVIFKTPGTGEKFRQGSYA